VSTRDNDGFLDMMENYFAQVRSQLMQRFGNDFRRISMSASAQATATIQAARA
jgi:hypothetical protein